MSKFLQAAKQFFADEEGVTAIEYGLLAALIAIVIIGTVDGIGGSLKTLFGSVQTAVAGAAS